MSTPKKITSFGLYTAYSYSRHVTIPTRQLNFKFGTFFPKVSSDEKPNISIGRKTHFTGIQPQSSWLLNFFASNATSFTLVPTAQIF